VKPAWYENQGEISFNVDVDGNGRRHRVAWHHGRLALPDHDLAAEAVLDAPGGDRCPCLLVLDILKAGELTPEGLDWARLLQRPLPWVLPRLSSILGRVPQPMLVSIGSNALAPHWSVRQAFEYLGSYHTNDALPPDQRLQPLARVHEQLLEELVPPVIAGLMARMAEVRNHRAHERRAAPKLPRTAQELLQSAAAPSFEQAMRWSRRDLRPHCSITVEVQKVSDVPGVKGLLSANSGSATVFLPLRWLNSVWLRGMSLVNGFFVINADSEAPAIDLSGQAVRWERQPSGSSVPVVADCALVRRDGTWGLLWSTPPSL
jgi:hypothetical protein